MLETSFAFLREMAVNNHKAWFDAHRTEYERAKDEVEAFVFQLFPRLGIDRGTRKASSWFHRFYRDTRFSNDKTPYKSWFSCVISAEGKKSAHTLGTYLHLQPGNQSLVGGGLWLPTPPQLKNFRLDMEDGCRTFVKILNEPKFKDSFHFSEEDKLKKVPRGFSEDHPAAEFLKLRHLTVFANFTDDQVHAPDFPHVVVQTIETLAPFLRYMEHATGMRGSED